MASFYYLGLGRSSVYVRTRTFRLSLHDTKILDSLLIMFVTFMLLGTQQSSGAPRGSEQLNLWATFLGVTSTLLAAFQYLPQIIHTYHHKLVGALSIPMMLIQTPGATLMVLSIALR